MPGWQFIDNDVKKVTNGFVSMEDMFEKHSNRKFDPDKDTILNSVYQQAQAAAQYGGEESNQFVDETEGGKEVGAQNPFEQFDTQKSLESDPIWGGTKSWLKDRGMIQ